MRTLLVLVVVGCSSPAGQTPVVPPTQPPVDPVRESIGTAPAPAQRTPRYDAKTLYETVAMGGGSFSQDGSRILISSDATGVFNVYAQPVGGGAPVQLTKSTKDSHYAVSFFPADDRYLFTADSGGNELTHLWVADKDGTTKDLTPGDKVKASFQRWSKDRKWFYVTTNERDPIHK